MNPIVSVVIPTCNRPTLLQRAIESVLAQTFNNWELIVVGDGPTDTVRQVITHYCQQNHRIRAVFQDNAGPSAARNAGIRVAQGQYVAFLDDDDRWLPDKLKRQVERFKQEPSLGFLYTKCFVEKDGVITDTWPYHMLNSYKKLYQGNFIPTLTVMTRKECLGAVGGFDPKLLVSHDYDLWLRIASRYSFEGIPEALAIYRFPQPGGGNISLDTITRYRNHIRLLQRIPANSRLGISRPERTKRISQVHITLIGLYSQHLAHRQVVLQYIQMVVKWPWVGLLFRDPETEHWRFTAPYRFLKPYWMIGYFSFKAFRQWFLKKPRYEHVVAQ